MAQSIGKTDDWSGRVLEVREDYTILINIPNTLASSITVEGISHDDAILIKKGDTVRFTGIIGDIVDFLGLHISVTGGKIIK